MRNYSEATVVRTEVARGNYNNSLAYARNEQSKAADNVSFTIDNDPNDATQGIVYKHEGLNGGNPPYQPIVHSKKPVSLTSEAKQI